MDVELEAIETYETSLDVRRLRQFIADEWPALKSALERGGSSDVPSSPEKAILIKPAGSGFTATEIVVLVAPALAVALKDVWNKIALPRLIERYGANSIRSKRPNSKRSKK
jgi:hypothetical protein